MIYECINCGMLQDSNVGGCPNCGRESEITIWNEYDYSGLGPLGKGCVVVIFVGIAVVCCVILAVYYFWR